MFGFATPFKSVRWNLSESSRKVMGSQWCAHHDRVEAQKREQEEAFKKLMEKISLGKQRLSELRERLQSIES